MHNHLYFNENSKNKILIITLFIYTLNLLRFKIHDF